MKLFVGCAIIVVASVFATASAEADAGFFIPKAFYTLDSEGHQTQPHPVSPHTAQYLNRLRRQVVSSSSSSSSSSYSSSGDGRPIVFGTTSTSSHGPQGSFSVVSRFGDDGSSSTSSHGSGFGGNYPNSNSGAYDSNYHSGAGQYGTNSNNYGTNSYNDHAYHPVPQYSGASASSSLHSGNDGKVVFKTEQSVTSTNPNAHTNFQNRFGGDDIPQTVSKTVSTTGYIDEKGVVHSKTTTTKH
uniref:Uncharacterized protein n=1 Tax=Zeugodacus cucurbitae TaxID=28588 RepID=A0A0A1XH49_ZEUCU